MSLYIAIVRGHCLVTMWRAKKVLRCYIDMIILAIWWLMCVMVLLNMPIHMTLPIRVGIAIWRRHTGSYMKCINSIRLQTTSALLWSQRQNAMILGCWGRRVGSNVSICTILLGCMTDDVSTVAEPKTQCHDIGLLRPMCWVRRVYMHHVVKLHDRRRQQCCGAKDAMPWYWVAEVDMLGRMCLYAPFWNNDLLSYELRMD